MATRPDDRSSGQVLTKSRTDVQRPPLYRVLLHNDDYTPMDFVIEVLQQVFDKDRPEAVHLTMVVHTEGNAVAGVYPREVAEMKVLEASTLARAQGHPFELSMEPEPG